MSPEPLDVLIVGAGPAGLSAAVGAIHRGAKRVLVVDQARALRPIGQGMDILPNAVRSLCALAPQVRHNLDPYIHVTPPEKVRARFISTKGHELPPIRLAAYGELATLRWWQLQKVLLDSLPDKDVVLLNHHLVNVVHEEDTGLACAEFVVDRQGENKFKNWDGNYDKPENISSAKVYRDGTSHYDLSEPPADEQVETGLTGGRRVTFKAKLIIGADGINSVVRRCVYRDCNSDWERFSDPVYSGMTRVACLPKQDYDMEEEDAMWLMNNCIKNGELCFLTCDKETISPWSPRALIFRSNNMGPITPRPFSISYFLPIDEETMSTRSNHELAQVAVGHLTKAGFPEQMVRLSASVWQESTEEEIPVRRHYVLVASHPAAFDNPDTMPKVSYPEDFRRPWWNKRVVVIGDAAHAMPNFLAQGAAMGIEDAYELTNLLGASGIWSTDEEYIPDEKEVGRVFQTYHDARLDRVCLVQKRTMNRLSEFDMDLRKELDDTIFNYKPPTEADAINLLSRTL